MQKNDWALILGASSGFGAASARALANAGVNIFGIHLDRKATMANVEALVVDIEATGQKAVFINMNASDATRRAEAVERLKQAVGTGRVKVLLHSLAFGALKPFFAETPKDSLNQAQIEMTLDVMANSLIYWTQDVYRAGLLKKGSHIFGMTSAGSHRMWRSYGAVSGAKTILESNLRQIAFELSSEGIAANAIQAGVTDTPALRKIPENVKMIQYAISLNPGKRLTVPQDVAQTIVDIGLSENTWLTGNIIRVDGGEDIAG
ncbi:MAG: SDR family oxidoreductase [Candidatus Marinimicrobia bacterium]|nr:SDR family oxidoreductase [Candidatus Neomarinimicrobiota bacterium]MCF7840357.1 SDR family oxidoreductase [Candidatus Neomarinimicrobiota bacterium]MCF7903196.1 SDR family oxidoreductase [Candidatus Neomarinimicrobiota bacterium]